MFSSQGYVCHFHQVMQLYIHPGLSRGRPHKKAYMIVFKFRIGSKLEPQKKSETAEKQGLKKHCCWNERMRLNYIHWSMSLLHGGPRCDPVQTSDIWCKHNVSIYNEETFGSHISAKHWTWNTTAWAVLDFSARQMCLAWSETVVLPSWNLTTNYFSSIWFCSSSWKLIPILSARCRFDGEARTNSHLVKIVTVTLRKLGLWAIELLVELLADTFPKLILLVWKLGREIFLNFPFPGHLGWIHTHRCWKILWKNLRQWRNLRRLGFPKRSHVNASNKKYRIGPLFFT